MAGTLGANVNVSRGELCWFRGGLLKNIFMPKTIVDVRGGEIRLTPKVAADLPLLVSLDRRHRKLSCKVVHDERAGQQGMERVVICYIYSSKIHC